MKDENSMPTAQKMTDVSLSIFRSKFKKTRIQMIDYSRRATAAEQAISAKMKIGRPWIRREKLTGLPQ